MKSQKKSTYNLSIENVKKGAELKFLIHSNGYELKDIAKELNISTTAVSRSIYGLSKIVRVENWLKENLNI